LPTLPQREFVELGAGASLRPSCSPLGYAPRILVVEDEPSVQLFIESVLSDVAYYVTVVPTARMALAQARSRQFDLLIVDLSLPDRDGIELVRELHSESALSRILAISGFMVGDMPNTVRAAGAADTLAKPMVRTKLLNAVYQLLDTGRAIRACCEDFAVMLQADSEGCGTGAFAGAKVRGCVTEPL